MTSVVPSWPARYTRPLAPTGDADRAQRAAAEAARQNRDAVLVHRGRDRIHGQARSLPDNLSRLQIVAIDLVHRGRDDLRFAADVNDERRAPAVDLLPVRAPQFGAGQLVQRGDEGLSLMIPLDNDAVPVEDGSLPFAELLAHLLVAEIFFPQQLSVHVIRVEAERIEIRVDVLAVGHRGRGRPGTPLRVRALVRRVLARGALPRDLSCLAV